MQPEKSIYSDSTTQEFIQHFWDDLSTDIVKNRIPLPTLPEITLKTRKLLDDRDTPFAKVSRVIGADAVLSTRLLRVANSPMYRGNNSIDDVKSAVTRLGNTTVRNIVSSLAMQTLYQCSLPKEIKRLLLENWAHSLKTAAIAYFLAKNFTRLNPDEAMLAGLIHDIGTLPILEYAELYPELLHDESMLRAVIHELHPRVGRLILESWNFSEELTNVVAEHEDLTRDPGSEADYVDLVIVANLLSHIGRKTPHPAHSKIDWLSVSAFRRINLAPEDAITTIKEACNELADIQKLFSS